MKLRTLAKVVLTATLTSLFLYGFWDIHFWVSPLPKEIMPPRMFVVGVLHLVGIFVPAFYLAETND